MAGLGYQHDAPACKPTELNILKSDTKQFVEKYTSIAQRVI